MLKDLVELKAMVEDAMIIFRGRDRNTCVRLAIRAGADINLPYESTYSAFGGGRERRVRRAIKRELRRRARHSNTVILRCLYWELT